MFIGLLFVLAGVLIAVYPPFLAFIAAGMLIFIGVVLISVSRYYKKIRRDIEDPFLRFFIRF